MRPSILMDFDGVIFDFNKAFASHLRGNGWEIPHPFVPNTVRWDDDDFFKEQKEDLLVEYDNFIESGFYIEPYPGAVEFLDEVDKVFDIVYCTARCGKIMEMSTYIAIAEHNLPLGSLVFSPEKGKIASMMGVLFAVEDDPSHIEDLLRNKVMVIVPGMVYNKKTPLRGALYIDTYMEALEALWSALE